MFAITAGPDTYALLRLGRLEAAIRGRRTFSLRTRLRLLWRRIVR